MVIFFKWIFELQLVRPSWLIAFALVTIGCTSQPHVGYVAATKSGCCSSLAEVIFRPIPLGHEMDVSITAEAPILSFSGTPEHFVALKVPDDFKAMSIQIKSYLSTTYLPNSTALIPEFIFLDAKNEVVGKAALDNVRVAGEFIRSGIFSGSVMVPAGSRFIVIVAGKGNSRVPAYPSANGRPYIIPLAALGELSLRIFGKSETK